jgi:predicted AAA+ superfamily ATPase
MILREAYLNKITPYVGAPLVKVLTGIRRSGKSTILLMLQERLKEQGVNESQIHRYSFDLLDDALFLSADVLYQDISRAIEQSPYSEHYVFLDEVQEVEGWEHVVNTLQAKGLADVYITGSNSRLLSSELSTYLTGRYITFEVYPLSFAEFLDFQHMAATAKPDEKNRRVQPSSGDLRMLFDRFLFSGGFPVVQAIPLDRNQARQVTNDIYNSILFRDVVQRNNIRNPDMLARIVRFLFENIGSPFSAKRIADEFKKQRRPIDAETVYAYTRALEEAFVLHRIPRFDLRGKELLKTQEKFFPGEHSLPFMLAGFRDRLIPGVLEGIVLLEALRRGYAPSIGKLNEREIDFVLQKDSSRIYVQVCYSLGSRIDTTLREFSPLENLRALGDDYPKYMVVYDRLETDDHEGVACVPLPQFLLQKDW